jgi:hypothetical protein
VTDRSHWTVRKYKLGEEPEYDETTMKMTPGQRIELVWELTKQQWELKEPGWHESPFRRDVVRIIRRRG